MQVPLSLSQSFRARSRKISQKSHPFDGRTLAQPDIQPNIITNHMIFSENVQKLMPSNTKYFTVVRNPYNQMLSSFNYFHHLDFFKKYELGTDGLSAFLSNTENFYKNKDKRKDSIKFLTRQNTKLLHHTV